MPAAHLANASLLVLICLRRPSPHGIGCGTWIALRLPETLKPEDRVAMKPHASPVFHAMQYLMGNQTREKLEKKWAEYQQEMVPSNFKWEDDGPLAGLVSAGATAAELADVARGLEHLDALLLLVGLVDR